MQQVKKIVIVMLILLSLNLYIPRMSFAIDTSILAKADITEHSPESVSTPEIEIPHDDKTPSEKGDKGWMLVIIAVIVGVGGAVIAGNSGWDSNSNNNGSITVNW